MDNRLAVGLDFAFSFPAWFLTDHGHKSVRELWAAAELHGEEWLKECAPPFWGRPGQTSETESTFEPRNDSLTLFAASCLNPYFRLAAREQWELDPFEICPLSPV